jgi:hypothetical protein
MRQEIFPEIIDGELIFRKKRIDVNPYLFSNKYHSSVSRCAGGYILNGYRGAIFGINYVIK